MIASPFQSIGGGDLGGTYNRLTIRDYNINFLFATFSFLARRARTITSLAVSKAWSLAMAAHLALHLHLRLNDPEVRAEEL